MNLVIDIGNTRIKFGVFDGGKLIAQWDEGGNHSLSSYPIERVALCSVRAEDPPELAELIAAWPLHRVSYKSTLPFTTRYQTPETLGADRIADLAGVATLHPGKDVLVIDAGTCITYDFMDKQSVHHGGAISPGIGMRFKALHQFTGKLPLVNPSDSPLIGTSTGGSIASGVINGVLAEVEGIISQYQADHSGFQVVLTGGDAALIGPKLKTRIFAEPDLVLHGLHRILELNEISR